jgi:hypothetical protein
MPGNRPTYLDKGLLRQGALHHIHDLSNNLDVAHCVISVAIDPVNARPKMRRVRPPDFALYLQVQLKARHRADALLIEIQPDQVIDINAEQYSTSTGTSL